MRFSERHGHKKIRRLAQKESIDDELRIGLWNVLSVTVWGDAEGFLSKSRNIPLRTLCRRLWFNYLKKPVDQIDDWWPTTLDALRAYFSACKWFEVYDFVEFIGENYDFPDKGKVFNESVNMVLERELSAFRIVDGVITQITTQAEIKSIEDAIAKADEPVAVHLHRALELLSDRTSPDYRNSVKESISAVESLVIKITGNEKGTLGQLIKKMEDRVGMHPALRNAFSSLYGYTSDEGGVRHALMDSPNVDFNDAKFMLVVCSAFVGFVEGKPKAS